MKVIVDIDGTVSLVGDRLKYLDQDPKDWDSFYEACGEDAPNWQIIYLVGVLMNNGYDIVFVTGRRESVRHQTVIWLQKYFLKTFFPDKLLMRPDGDIRHDVLVKPELLDLAGIKRPDVAFILEDRSSMVSQWRALGFTCLQVADGDF